MVGMARLQDETSVLDCCFILKPITKCLMGETVSRKSVKRPGRINSTFRLFSLNIISSIHIAIHWRL